MYKVDYNDSSLTRIPKSSAYVFSNITRNRQLPAEYLRTTTENMSGIVTDHYQSYTTSPSAANRKETFFNYRGMFSYIWLTTVICNAYIFVS
jgi:hypothetical protein